MSLVDLNGYVYRMHTFVGIGRPSDESFLFIKRLILRLISLREAAHAF